MSRNLQNQHDDDRNHAFVRFKAGPIEADATINISSRGVIAVGTLVSMILLSVVPIVRAANRKIPPAD